MSEEAKKARRKGHEYAAQSLYIKAIDCFEQAVQLGLNGEVLTFKRRWGLAPLRGSESKQKWKPESGLEKQQLRCVRLFIVSGFTMCC